MWVKVCGLRRREDVEAAVAAGADAVGFVVGPSPRRVAVGDVQELTRDIDVARVLVTVDTSPDELMRLVDVTGVTAVQPHGMHSVRAGDEAVARGMMVLHPVPVGDAVDLGSIGDDRLPLLDTYRRDLHGGSGLSFDWNLAADLRRDFVLAGGLNPSNVIEAIERVRPWGVDASSGLESAPGIKDHELIRAFVRKAKHR